MKEIKSYPPGTPNWTDVMSTDLDASIAFYQDVA